MGEWRRHPRLFKKDVKSKQVRVLSRILLLLRELTVCALVATAAEGVHCAGVLNIVADVAGQVTHVTDVLLTGVSAGCAVPHVLFLRDSRC